MKERLQKDIDELLSNSLESIKEIKGKNIVSKVRVKNILENLRSSLEYSAQYINSLLSSPNQKVYFPYGDNEEKFILSVNKNLPNLESELPDIYELLNALQPHFLDDRWLFDLCRATNIAKHNKSLDIEEVESSKKIFTGIKANNFNLIRGNLKNLTFYGNIMDERRLDNFELRNGELCNLSKGEIAIEFDFEIVNHNKIIINDIECDLFEFLEVSYLNIADYTKKLFNI